MGPPALDRCFRSRQFISMSDFDTLAVTDSDLRQARCIPFMWSSGFTTNFWAPAIQPLLGTLYQQ